MTDKVVIILAALCFLLACGFFILLLVLRKTREQQQKNQVDLNEYDRLTGLGSETKFTADGASFKDFDTHAIISIYLNRFSELYSLFGAPTADGVLNRFCHELEQLAIEQNGQAYRITFDHVVLVVCADDRAAFLEKVQIFMKEAEQLHIKLAGAAYAYHFSLRYGIYFLSNANDADTDLSDILAYLDAQIQHSTAKSAADCIILDENNEPDWILLRALEQEAKRAWENQEFEPYYQPTFDLNTGKAMGSEILARWQHPSRGLLTSNQFIPILEKKGLIFDLDLYMIEAACKKIQYWLDNGILTVPLAVNISALNVHRTDFIDRLVRLVTQYDVPPVLLELELPESALVLEDHETFVKKMDYLHKKGFSLSMDHFAATSFSALWLLRILPFDIIKVDYHFFEDVQRSKRSDIYVRNFLELTKQMNIKVVVTQLETAEQVKVAQSFGYTNGKGFYFSKPLSSDEFLEVIR